MGSSGGRLVSVGHTVIQVPVPALEPIAQRLGLTLVYPHITMLGPFVDRSDVDQNFVSSIREIVMPIHAFGFEFSAVGRFGDGLTYPAPDPVEPFIRITEMLFAAFPQCPPYGGAFDEVVPHASIGEALPEDAVTALRELLPINTAGDAVTLTWWIAIMNLGDGTFSAAIRLLRQTHNDARRRADRTCAV